MKVAQRKRTISKSELVHQIAAKSGQTLADTQKTLAAFTETVQDNLANGNQVRLMGFGSWDVRDVKSRRFRPINSQGGVETLPPSKRVGFQVGADLARIAKG